MAHRRVIIRLAKQIIGQALRKIGVSVGYGDCGENKVNFEIMKDIEFTIIASCALTRSIIEMLIHLEVDGTKKGSAHSVIKCCITTNCSN